MGIRGALGADAAPPRARQAASSSASSPCASHASGDAHGTVALLTLLRRVAIGAGVLCVLGVLWALKAHAGTLLALLATQVHSAGAWGVAGYVAAFAAWGVLCLPLSPFELLSGLPSQPLAERSPWPYPRLRALTRAPALLPGFLFPFWTALAACVLGKVCGAALCFLAGRTVGAGVARRADPNPNPSPSPNPNPNPDPDPNPSPSPNPNPNPDQVSRAVRSRVTRRCAHSVPPPPISPPYLP